MSSRHITILAMTLLATGASGIAAAPDLAVSWVRDASAGQAGKASWQAHIDNRGSTDAFALVLELSTGDKAASQRQRISPGPRAGQGIQWPIPRDLGGLGVTACATVHLQTLNARDPVDENQENDTACMAMEGRGEHMTEGVQLGRDKNP